MPDGFAMGEVSRARDVGSSDTDPLLIEAMHELEEKIAMLKLEEQRRATLETETSCLSLLSTVNALKERVLQLEASNKLLAQQIQN